MEAESEEGEGVLQRGKSGTLYRAVQRGKDDETGGI